MLDVRDVKLPLEETLQEKEALQRALCKRLRVPQEAILSLQILKESVDARKKDRIFILYRLLVRLAPGVRLRGTPPGVTPYAPEPQPALLIGGEPLNGPVVIAGFGPAGLFAALTLARSGYAPLVLERGEDVEARTQKVEAFWAGGALDPESNVQFGEGGAGTFSDGKLTTRIRDPRVQGILEDFVRAGAPEEIHYRNKPHVGTDLLKGVVRSLREAMIEAGGRILFTTRLEDLAARDGRLQEAKWGGQWHRVGALVLCPGHSARDTYEMLWARGVPLEAKSFAVGLRVEHLQEAIDACQYGQWAHHPKLRASEYTLAGRTGARRGVYSFCMCPGGQVVNASSEAGRLCVNGMSYHARDRRQANSALVVSVGPEDFGPLPLSAITFQRQLEEKAYQMGQGKDWAPVQRTCDFLEGTLTQRFEGVYPEVSPGFTSAPLHELLPEVLTQGLRDGLRLFGRRIRGFDSQGVLTGVESRTSAPLRILRGEGFFSPGFEGLYPCGEGAGYAGGIVSAAVDGVRIAQALMARYAPSPPLI
ncbi:NAD(FAD)-utilizing dehydrogenase [Clostridiaceae bacterium JG1575]|nr:NAD(FAD)-utilizing dehydrogenase [Clostridiaceae bacterium JG1575]